MVIINTQNAQLANRLWGFSSFIANSIEHGYTLVNIGFFRYHAYFEATKNNDFGRFPIKIKRTGIKFVDHFYSNLFKTWSSFTYKKFGKTPTVYKFYRTNYKEDLTQTIFDLNREDFVADAKKQKVLVQGWMFRDQVNIRKHRDKILQFFKPVQPYFSQVQKEIAAARELADVVIGVHIRRGDYATFAGGKWFFSDEQYALIMRQMGNAYVKEGKTCAFFIASNEAIDTAKYNGLIIVNSERHFIVDLYTLAECDAIIGPPSTFSQWAAFYGNKPLTMLLTGNETIGIPQFNPSFVAENDFPEKNLYRF